MAEDRRDVSLPWDSEGLVSITEALLKTAQEIGPPSAWEANGYTRDVWMRFGSEEHLSKWVAATQAEPQSDEESPPGDMQYVVRALVRVKDWSVHLAFYRNRHV